MATPRTSHSPADVVASYTVAAVAAGQILFGLGYIGACEFRATGPGQCESQWVTAQALLFGGTATTMGLNTRNPFIRRSPRPAPKAPAEPPLRVAKPRTRRSAD